jgi:hypothetical protein
MSITRSQRPLSISGVLVYWFVVENLISHVAPVRVARFLPFDAGFRLVNVGGAHDTPSARAVQFDRPQLALIFGAYATLAMVAGTVLLYRRDSS